MFGVPYRYDRQEDRRIKTGDIQTDRRFWCLKLFVKDTGPSLWYTISNIKTQEMPISSEF